MTAQSAAADLPGGFRSITFGLDIDTVKSWLDDDPYFDYRGEPDVSIVDTENRSIIECEGNSFIERGVFQFSANRLFIITLVLDRSKIDYFTMYSNLKDKYGDPYYLDPTQVVWEDDAVRLSIEKPLTVKYLYKPIFESIQQDKGGKKNVEEHTKEKFLEEF